MILYVRPNRKITNARIRNKIWRVLNGDDGLPSQHDCDHTYVEVEVRDLPGLLDKMCTHRTIRSYAGFTRTTRLRNARKNDGRNQS